MQIPLKNFEQYVSQTIVQRGLSYYKNGHVHEPEEITRGVYEATVEGTEDYTVRLTIENGIITKHTCDCPYDMGAVCKHLVAVIFYLKQSEAKISGKSQNITNASTSETSKRKTVAERVNEILEKITPEELKRFVREKAISDPPFRDLFLSSFEQRNSPESIAFYAKKIESILKKASGRHGFIEWSAANIVENAVENLLDSAQEQIDKQNYKSAFFVCAAVMEQLTKAMEYSDDSNGSIGGCIDSACEMLRSIAEEPIPEEIRKLIFEYCFTMFVQKTYSGWDWHIELLEILQSLLKTEEETERIFVQIDKIQEDGYEKDTSQTIKHEILLKVKGEAAANEYLEQNINNPKFRQRAIQNALERKDYEKAYSIATDGLAYDEKKPGLVKDWYNWLLKIAQAQNNKNKIINYARILFVDNYRQEQDYYQVLKQNVEPEKWVEFIENIITDISAKKWPNTDLMAHIFIKEKWWDRLWEMVRRSANIALIEQYEKYLSAYYARQLAELYANHIIRYMVTAMGRDHYQTACKYIKKISGYGAIDIANEVVVHLRTEYPKRRALIEELNKL